MNKRSLVILTTIITVVVFVTAAFVYQQKNKTETPLAMTLSKQAENSLIKFHSPILGAPNAPVTIVEFLDPSCEACRAFFPFVEKILHDYPQDVRVVVRYAAFHKGSDEAVRILEASRKQNLYIPVLTAFFEFQPQWAIHGSPRLDKAWEIAASTGLDVERARKDALSPSITEILAQDMADIKINNVKATPTFFVNGAQLTSVDPEQLRRVVEKEIQRVKATQTEANQ